MHKREEQISVVAIASDFGSQVRESDLVHEETQQAAMVRAAERRIEERYCVATQAGGSGMRMFECITNRIVFTTCATCTQTLSECYSELCVTLSGPKPGKG